MNKQTLIKYSIFAALICAVLVFIRQSPFWDYAATKQKLIDLLEHDDISDIRQRTLYFFNALDWEDSDDELIINQLIEWSYDPELQSGAAHVLSELAKSADISKQNRMTILRRLIGLNHHGSSGAGFTDGIVFNLEHEHLSIEEKKELLAAFMPIRIVKRAQYRADRPVRVDLKAAPLSTFESHRMEWRISTSRYDGTSWSSPRIPHSYSGGMHNTWDLPLSENQQWIHDPGLYQESITLHFDIYEGIIPPGPNETPVLSVEKTYPFTILVVRPDEFIPLIPVSDPELDQQVIDSLDNVSLTVNAFHKLKAHNGKTFQTNLKPSILFTDRPATCSFEMIFKDQRGGNYPLDNSYNIVDSAGMVGWGYIRSITQVGTYSGEMIFRASEGVAYQDPRVDVYWDGELRFPVEFEVREVDDR